MSRWNVETSHPFSSPFPHTYTQDNQEILPNVNRIDHQPNTIHQNASVFKSEWNFDDDIDEIDGLNVEGERGLEEKQKSAAELFGSSLHTTQSRESQSFEFRPQKETLESRTNVSSYSHPHNQPFTPITIHADSITSQHFAPDFGVPDKSVAEAYFFAQNPLSSHSSISAEDFFHTKTENKAQTEESRDSFSDTQHKIHSIELSAVTKTSHEECKEKNQIIPPLNLQSADFIGNPKNDSSMETAKQVEVEIEHEATLSTSTHVSTPHTTMLTPRTMNLSIEEGWHHLEMIADELAAVSELEDEDEIEEEELEDKELEGEELEEEELEEEELEDPKSSDYDSTNYHTGSYSEWLMTEEESEHEQKPSLVYAERDSQLYHSFEHKDFEPGSFADDSSLQDVKMTRKQLKRPKPKKATM